MSRRKSKTSEEKKSIADITAETLSAPSEIAWYYGFSEIKKLKITAEDAKLAKSFSETTGHEHGHDPLTIKSVEYVALLQNYIRYNLHTLPQPVMVSYCRPLSIENHKTGKPNELGLQIIGPSKSIAEAVTIQAAKAILAEEGYTETFLEINSGGDRESVARFERELVNYYRKHINDLPATLRQLFKKDIFEIARCDDPRAREFLENAPQSISFLSDQSRDHFKEVLESLERLDIPYKIKNSLVGSHDLFPQTIFSIREGTLQDKGGNILATGGRINYLAKKIGFRKETPIVGATVVLKRGAIGVKSRKVPKPKFYFIQLGPEAKLKSLSVIDALRAARIPTIHSITKDKIVGQMWSAESLKVPYLLIMGQKEAHENSVMVRNTTTRAQETIPIAELPKRLKKFK